MSVLLKKCFGKIQNKIKMVEKCFFSQMFIIQDFFVLDKKKSGAMLDENLGASMVSCFFSRPNKL